MKENADIFYKNISFSFLFMLKRMIKELLIRWDAERIEFFYKKGWEIGYDLITKEEAKKILEEILK